MRRVSNYAKQIPAEALDKPSPAKTTGRLARMNLRFGCELGMQAETLIEALRQAGIRLSVDGGDLVLRGPRKRLPGPKLRAEILRLKPAILAALECAPVGEARCFHCGGNGECDCISCGHYRAHMVWGPGPCLPCEARKRQRERVQ